MDGCRFCTLIVRAHIPEPGETDAFVRADTRRRCIDEVFVVILCVVFERGFYLLFISRVPGWGGGHSDHVLMTFRTAPYYNAIKINAVVKYIIFDLVIESK